MNLLDEFITFKQDKNYPKVTITEFKGILNLHLGTDWIQGGMRLNLPNGIVFDYVQQMMAWMLFNDQPNHIVQLGLGAGSLTKFCHHCFPENRVTAIELNPNVIKACHAFFYLPPENDRLSIIQADARDYLLSQKGRQAIDIFQIDLYDQNAQTPVFDSVEFFQQCADVMTSQGILTINIFGEQSNRKQTITNLQECFDAVVWFKETDGGNIVALAFKEAPCIDFETLYQRAKTIRRTTELKAINWVDDLYDWMKKTPPYTRHDSVLHYRHQTIITVPAN